MKLHCDAECNVLRATGWIHNNFRGILRSKAAEQSGTQGQWGIALQGFWGCQHWSLPKLRRLNFCPDLSNAQITSLLTLCELTFDQPLTLIWGPVFVAIYEHSWSHLCCKITHFYPLHSMCRTPSIEKLADWWTWCAFQQHTAQNCLSFDKSICWDWKSWRAGSYLCCQSPFSHLSDRINRRIAKRHAAIYHAAQYFG